MICNNTKLWEKFDGSCLKQDKISSSQKGVINLDIAYKTNFWSYDLNSNFILWSALRLLSELKIEKLITIHYSGYGIGFDTCSSFSLSKCGGLSQRSW